MSEQILKKRGRPATGQRPTFSFRLSPKNRQRLEQSAARSGLSLSEEIERRLDLSLLGDDVAAAARHAILEAMGVVSVHPLGLRSLTPICSDRFTHPEGGDCA